MRDFDEGVKNIRIGVETIPEKQTVRYLGAFFGANTNTKYTCDTGQTRNKVHRTFCRAHRRCGAPAGSLQSARFAHSWPKLCAATSSVYSSASMPEYSAGTAIRFWFSLALLHCEYGAASMVRASIPDFERTQANVGKAFINLLSSLLWAA